MGIEFRGSYYKKDVSLGKRTIKDGEAAAVWNRLGVHRQVVGPRLTRLFFSTIMFLDKRVAGPNEYLIVRLVDGTVNHIRGPITLFENPVLHQKIEVKQAYSLSSASECLVVNREIRLSNTEKTLQFEGSRIERVILRGPNLYFPLVGDTVVNFDWHGTPTNNSNTFNIVPNAQKFTILNTAPRQWKVDASFLPPAFQKSKQSFVETKPGTLQLTFNFQIVDVNAMLDNTFDVIGDLYDSLVVDLADIQTTTVNSQSQEEHSLSFSTWVIKTFSAIHSFPHLLARAAVIGVAIEAVSFRGYEQHAETKKQLADLKEIEIKLSRDRMITEQEQNKIESDLSARRSRLEQEKSLQQAQLAVKRETLQAEQEYREAELKHKLLQEEIQLKSDLSQATARNDETLRVMRELNSLGVDLTTLLCSHAKLETGNSLNTTAALVAKTPAFTLFDAQKK
jgi:hypothetical protein